MRFRHLTTADYSAFFSLRLKSLQDTPHMFATDAHAWQNSSRPVIENLLQASETKQSPILGAWQDSQLIALMGLKCESRPTVAHKATLWGIFVSPDQRRQGVGKRLLAFTIDGAREIPSLIQLRAVVNASSREAVVFFENSGFQQFGREPRAKLIAGNYHDQIYFWYPLDSENNA